MNLERTITNWTDGAAREWAMVRDRLPLVVERAQSGPARLAIEYWHSNLWSPVLVTPERVGAELQPFAPITDRAVAELQERLINGVTDDLALLGLVSFGNALECVGLQLVPKSWGAMRAWLSRVRVSRDDDRVYYYWTTGFAALAIDDRGTYAKICGFTGEVPQKPDPSYPKEPRGRFSFRPGLTFQCDVQGLLLYLAGAVEQRATFKDVEPAWEDLLWNYPVLRASRSLDPAALLWIARIVFHKVGGCRLGAVAQRLHDSAWTLAGIKP